MTLTNETKEYVPRGRRWVYVEAPDFRLLTEKINQLESMVEVEPITWESESLRGQFVHQVILNYNGTQAMVQVEVNR